MTDYEFQAERVEALIKDAATRVIDEFDLEEAWENLVDDGSESALLVTSEDLPRFVGRLAALPPGPDPRHGAWHREALDRLRQHDDCGSVIGELIAERDDAIASITWARDYLHSDAFPGEYGDLYVDPERVLDLLRPTIRGEGKWRDLLPPGECPWCRTQFGHDEDCPVEEREDELREQRNHLVASHLHCEEIGRSLVTHTTRCLDRVEHIAARIHSNTKESSSGTVVEPDNVLPVQIADLNVSFDEADPATLALTIYPDLQD